MEENQNSKKTLVIAAAAALALVVILILIFVLAVQGSGHEQIVLPEEAPGTEQIPAAQPAVQEEPGFAQVTPKNVQSIVSSLTPPSAYHQMLDLTISAEQHQRDQRIDLWRSNDLTFCRTSENGLPSCSFLTDGETLYYWFSDSESVTPIQMDSSLSPEDLVGIPDYLSLLDTPVRQIKETGFVTPEEENAPQCVYVRCEDGEQERQYWIDLSSGLLYRQLVLEQGQQVYSLSLVWQEVLMDSDETLRDVFSLPDGRQPFTEG